MITHIEPECEALEASRQMYGIVNGSLAEDIDRLIWTGRLLSDPNYWDGRRTQQFREEWPQMHQPLIKARGCVEQLRVQADEILREIMKAVGWG